MTVIWTLRALKTYFNVSDHLQKEWGNKVVRDFAIDVQRVIKEISENPYMFEASYKYRHIRKGFVTEHNSIFYRIKPQKKAIEILVFWDNRQDDQRRPY